jgi:REP element-mobilizing transposase RayT
MAGRSPQLELALPKTWGGRRAGAGRKLAPGRRRSTPHRARPEHKRAHPVHLTMRARAGLRSLRQGPVFAAVAGAIVAARRESFRVVHFSVQRDHLHLIIEASDKRSLSSGVSGLAIRIARAVNRALGREGRLWGDRYHTHALRSPREVRNGLVYVLMNFRKHQDASASSPSIDPCSSAPWFDGFRTSDGQTRAPASKVPPPVSPARTWLASRGWRKRGLIHLNEKPGPVVVKAPSA